jgi:adenosylhomocysteine nucleosidase
VLSGVGKEKALNSIRDLMKSYSVNALLSIGIAGAVDPILEVGDVVLGREIFCLGDNKKLVSDKQLLKSAGEACEQLSKRYFMGNIITVPKIVNRKEEKSEIYEKYRTIAVEMETYYIVREVAKKNIPFVSIRSISDRADQSIKIDFGQVSRRVMHKKLYVLNHPVAYFRIVKLNKDITKAASHLPPIVFNTLMNWYVKENNLLAQKS